ncbi:MAG TPA: S24 family peptidase [Streptosporangiaceae bacterium]|jgi:phage repressor protein C with HTH and peptisase S24 domain|nr:S24 family peptidase [Streptosporangiaceae bacterium]
MRLMTVLVKGESMLPALRPGDRLIVRLGAPVRPGDIVVARYPRSAAPDRDPAGGPDADRDGERASDAAAVLIIKRAFRRTPAGWWLESDNQRAAGRRDSWDFGAVPDPDITGRVVGRYWPPSRLTLSLPYRSRGRTRKRSG